MHELETPWLRLLSAAFTYRPAGVAIAALPTTGLGARSRTFELLRGVVAYQLDHCSDADYGLTRTTLHERLLTVDGVTPADRAAAASIYCEAQMKVTPHSEVPSLIELLRSKAEREEAARKVREGIAVLERLNGPSASAERVKAYVGEPPPERTTFSFDLTRLPKEITQGLVGLVARNPKMPAGTAIMLPFVLAGVAIGKRKAVDNMSNLYYPNLWVILLGKTGANKSGTFNAINDYVPRLNKVGNSPTCEALLDEMGKYIVTKGRSRAEVLNEEEQYEAECRADLDGRVLVTDEIIGTLRTMIGDKDQNLDQILNLATSGKHIAQPRVTAGKRVVYDACLSLVGLTQPSDWARTFDTDRYREKGFIGRFIPCVDIALEGLPIGRREDWDAFCGATRALAGRLGGATLNVDPDPFSGGGRGLDEPQHPAARPDAVQCGDMVDDALPALRTSPLFVELRQLVGDEFAEGLKGKLIGHALKMAMVCELYGGSLGDHFSTCFDLVTLTYFEHFRMSIAETAPLNTEEMRALNYIRLNPGCTLRDIQRKHNLRDAKETWDLLGRLEERGLVKSTENVKRKGSHVLTAIRQ